MALLDRLKKAMTSTDDSELQYRYHCRECDSSFEQAETSVSRVECPRCGATGSRSISKL
ncbi:hypothetical protein ACKVMT_00770 [Halobacteriales archaeon Cl-PHB]